MITKSRSMCYKHNNKETKCKSSQQKDKKKSSARSLFEIECFTLQINRMLCCCFGVDFVLNSAEMMHICYRRVLTAGAAMA